MKKAAYNIIPKTEEILRIMGEQIKLARLRRDLTSELVAERCWDKQVFFVEGGVRRSCCCHGYICRGASCIERYGQGSASYR